jgi:hypothetical protein
MLKSFLAATLCVLLFACSNDKKTASVPTFKQSPLDSAYAPIRPAVQKFSIDNSKVSRVKAANGTEILIPANCFVTASGDPVQQAELEVAEVFSLDGFITAGLVTISDGRLLISNGMLYINARSGKEQLQLQPGASLTVNMPTMANNSGFQLFSGDPTNWTVDSAMADIDYAMPLPLDLLYPEGKKTFWYCIEDAGGKGEKTHVIDTNIVDVTNSKYENTVIATEEFLYRTHTLRQMQYKMSYFINSDYYLKDNICGGQTFNYDLWKVYLEHPTRSLRESDSIANKMYVDYFHTNKDKLAAFFEEVNKYKRTTYYNWTDTNYYFDFRQQSMEDFFMETLKDFPAGRPKELKLIDSHGVNLSSSNVYEQLSTKGVATKEINEIMTYHFRRQSKIRELQKAKNMIVNKNALEQMYRSTVFSVSRLGWINCDLFYDDPAAGPARMYVSNSSGNQLDFIDWSLVIPALNARLSAHKDSTGLWTFTRNEKPYTKLPIGQEAVVTGISLQHDSLFFVSRKITIRDSLALAMPLQYIPKNVLKDSLSAAMR